MTRSRSWGLRAVARFPTLGLPLFKLFMILRFLAGRRTRTTLYFGAALGIDLWQMMQQRMYYFRFWEPNVSSLVEETLREGDLFVDLGANVGYFTLLASHLVGESGGVVSVEALPSNFAQLQANIARNRATNVRAVNCAASDTAGELTIYGGAFRNSGTATTIRTEGREVAGRVPALPLDEILTPEERARVRLIKIDIEGSELPVLQRLLATLQSYPADLQVICEFDMNLGGEPLRDAFQAFRAAGFEALRIPNPYDYAAYLNWAGREPLTPIHELPAGGCDVLLRRRA